jgi:uncharacterized surface protein with fasciclin (FAS1) repeats
MVWSSLFVSCKDEYPYDDEEPEWLGESIYDYLVSKGNYTCFVKIINDLSYTEVLSKTGSKTLFVADDEAFERFFQGNPWGVTSIDQMTMAQKKILLNFCMINNAYLIETLSNYYDRYTGVLQEGFAMRRETAVSVLDTVPFLSGDQLPDSKYWLPFKSRGMYLLKDDSSWPLVHFMQKVLDYNGITDADFKVMTGIDRQRNNAHIFGNKVIEPDIACKNGYVNRLENVLIPPGNMADYIRTKPNLSLFSELMDRFCAPYYDEENTNNYKELHETFTDSIFTMKFFVTASNTGRVQGGTQRYPSGAQIPEALLLPFDPGWNSYSYEYGSLQSDMAAIFAPTNEALDEYFKSGSGRVLKERYGSWENVPNDILALLLTRHMRESLVNSVPSNFYKMVDKRGSKLNASSSDIIDSLNFIGVNGLVYVTNKIYPPDDYESVYGPVLFSNKTTIINWVIKEYLYHLYLNSMVNTYAFLAPTDIALQSYIDPLTWGSSMPTALKFWYDSRTLSAKATVYNFDKTTGTVGDSVTLITDENFIKSRLVRILDQSIIIGDFKNKGGHFSDGFYVTKDGNIVKVSDITGIAGQSDSRITTFQGGDDIENGNFVNIIDSGIYHQKNGTTFFVNSIYKTPFQSVYKVLSDSVKYPSFDAFFKLCDQFPSQNVFVRKANNYGIDKNIKFFNTFRYTVYVPTNEAMEQAYDDGLIFRWEDINKETNQAVQDTMIKHNERFVRYHFQDNSVFIHPSQSVDQLYQTATIKENGGPSFHNTYKNKFYRIHAKSNIEGGLDLTTEFYRTVNGKKEPQTVKVVPVAGLYNIMTRDYIFNLNPTSLTSLKTSAYSTSEITTSSTAVIHQINEVLRFE